MTIADPGVAPVDWSDKQSVIRTMYTVTSTDMRRIDGLEAFGTAYDVFMSVYDPLLHSETPAKTFFKQNALGDFVRIKNLRAMVWAFDWLRVHHSTN